MSLSTFFGFNNGNDVSVELPNIYSFGVIKSDFIEADVFHIYSKILTDVVERTHGLSEEQVPLLFDNCLGDETKDGLITLLAKAMLQKQDLYLVYSKPLRVLRKANDTEKRQIEADYKLKGTSAIGIYVSFKNYKKTDLIKIFSELEYCALYSLNKGMNLSTAIQLKLEGLRASVASVDSSVATKQALTIANGLKSGKDVLLDGKDSIVNAVVDISSTENAIMFLNQKRAFYLGLPNSYITGEQTTGISSTGEADTKAIERGLKTYYVSIVKPVLDQLFGISVSYKSQDQKQIALGLQAVQTFELIDDSLIDSENKKRIVSQLFDIDDNYAKDL
jgi:hypothetical protein